VCAPALAEAESAVNYNYNNNERVVRDGLFNVACLFSAQAAAEAATAAAAAAAKLHSLSFQFLF